MDVETLDPFNPAALCLPQDFTETANVEKLLLTVPVRKPNRQDFVRVHPDPAYRLPSVGLLELKDEREIYLVSPDLAAGLANEFDPCTLYTAVNRQNVVFLWPVKLPREDRRGSGEWARTAREAAELAMTKWVRMTASMSLGAYEISVAKNGIADPAWPNLPFHELLKIAFKDRHINSDAHPVIHRLRGLE